MLNQLINNGMTLLCTVSEEVEKIICCVHYQGNLDFRDDVSVNTACQKERARIVHNCCFNAKTLESTRNCAASDDVRGAVFARVT